LALLLLFFAMAAIGVTLTGVGGAVAQVSLVVFIVTLGLAVLALILARRDAEAGDSRRRETVPETWEPVRWRAQYHLEDEVSGSLVSLKGRRRL
jgi:hypothetical protein